MRAWRADVERAQGREQKSEETARTYGGWEGGGLAGAGGGRREGPRRARVGHDACVREWATTCVRACEGGRLSVRARNDRTSGWRVGGGAWSLTLVLELQFADRGRSSFARMAKWLRRWLYMPEVPGSIPGTGILREKIKS